MMMKLNHAEDNYIMNIRATLTVSLVTTVAFAVVSVILLSPVYATSSKDNVPLGRTPAAIVDGQYPASYFPNTELLGAGEMRIIALGTGMPNQTKRAVSISYLV
jgi:ribonuclease Z